ncbi:hypothetical protein PMI41_00330 [Phyllobacterium sp. YR531]|nr:hypothetical protein PMI41_00330 [Phyllobacterium sp. YR531]
MKKKAFGQIYFTGLIVSFVTFASMLSGCAQVYYGTFRYEANCMDRPVNDDVVCKVKRTR